MVWPGGRRGWGARLALLLVGCSSSSTPAPAPAPTPAKCSCSVSVNGQDTTIACREEACLAGTSYRCGADRAIAKGGTCAAAPDASAPDAGGEGTCEEPACATDAECTAIAASWRCFALDRPDAKKACFPTETILFQGDDAPSCLEESRRIVTASCQDGDTPICVPTACQAAANQPAPTQARTCR
jgi:hypothetical protein